MDKAYQIGNWQRSMVIQSAHCPNGCDLMNDEVTIRGYKSIAVLLYWQNQKGIIYLDPEFGKYEHRCDITIPEGSIVDFFCPHCGISLKHGSEICPSCSAPTFGLVLPKEGEIIGCLRRGCFEHTLKLVSLEAMQLQIEENFYRLIL
jgi:hypothetical protein